MDQLLDVHGNPRLGYGRRHPEVQRFLEVTEPLHVEDAARPGGVPMVARAFAPAPPLPDVVVSSVRCIVRVDGYVVVCHNADGVRHVWPGGGREPGETFEDTACREVHEETGWLVDRASLRQIGWLHLEAVGEVPPAHPFPHPDAFHAVLVGEARARAGAHWTDTEGYELSSELVLAAQARNFLHRDPLSARFLDLVLAGA
jgi:8-oxo-dGTP pyrophosphatase MutT (NUDIX family)